MTIRDVCQRAEAVVLQFEQKIRMVKRSGNPREGHRLYLRETHKLILGECTGMVQITSKPSIHRVSRSLPRLDSAFQHLDVRKALFLVFRCLTDSARFGGSSSIENDFLCLRQRRRPRLEAGEGYGPVQI